MNSVSHGSNGMNSVSHGSNGMNSVSHGSNGVHSVSHGSNGIHSVSHGSNGIHSVSHGSNGMNSVLRSDRSDCGRVDNGASPSHSLLHWGLEIRTRENLGNLGFLGGLCLTDCLGELGLIRSDTNRGGFRVLCRPDGMLDVARFEVAPQFRQAGLLFECHGYTPL
jgi:hypothetical protein